jgi:excisionase family DNA binding protein
MHRRVMEDRDVSDELQTIDQIAQRMGVSARTVHRLIERGELRAVRLPAGRGQRVLESDYQAFLERLKHPVPALAVRRRVS